VGVGFEMGLGPGLGMGQILVRFGSTIAASSLALAPVLAGSTAWIGLDSVCAICCFLG